MEVRVRKLEGTQPVKPGPASAGIWVKRNEGGDDDNVFCYSASEDGVDTTFELPHAGQVVKSAEITFTEQGAGEYEGSVALPAGAVLVDIIVNGVALWTAETSATLIVGDTDPDGYYTAVDLKATDLLAGESISFALAGGKAGAYIANSQVSPRYSAAARNIVANVVSVGAGTAGRTRVNVLWIEPTAADSSTVEATFTAEEE